MYYVTVNLIKILILNNLFFLKLLFAVKILILIQAEHNFSSIDPSIPVVIFVTIDHVCGGFLAEIMFLRIRLNAMRYFVRPTAYYCTQCTIYNMVIVVLNMCPVLNIFTYVQFVLLKHILACTAKQTKIFDDFCAFCVSSFVYK